MKTPLTFVEYAATAKRTAIYPGHDQPGGCILYPVLGLVDEVGEFVRKLLPDILASAPSKEAFDLDGNVAYYAAVDCLLMVSRIGLVAGVYKKAHRDGDGETPGLLTKKAYAKAAIEFEALSEASAGLPMGLFDYVRGHLHSSGGDAVVFVLPAIAISSETATAAAPEGGDSLWYLCDSLDTLGSSIEAAAEYNTRTLLSRLERGTLRGSGDNR